MTDEDRLAVDRHIAALCIIEDALGKLQLRFAGAPDDVTGRLNAKARGRIVESMAHLGNAIESLRGFDEDFK